MSLEWIFGFSGCSERGKAQRERNYFLGDLGNSRVLRLKIPKFHDKCRNFLCKFHDKPRNYFCKFHDKCRNGFLSEFQNFTINAVIFGVKMASKIFKIFQK